jgi:hypothetical protein
MRMYVNHYDGLISGTDHRTQPSFDPSHNPRINTNHHHLHRLIMNLYLSSGMSVTTQTFIDDHGRVVYISDTPAPLGTTSIQRGDGTPVTRIIWKNTGPPSAMIEQDGRTVSIKEILKSRRRRVSGSGQTEWVGTCVLGVHHARVCMI